MHAPPAPSRRLPKNYRIVNDVVREHAHGRHLAMADIHALAKRSQPRIGFTTVYRALNRLSRLGLIAEVRVPGADMTYYETPVAPHAHFHCEGCGRIDDLDYHLPSGDVERIAGSYGIDVREAAVTMSGRCPACREAAPAS